MSVFCYLLSRGRRIIGLCIKRLLCNETEAQTSFRVRKRLRSQEPDNGRGNGEEQTKGLRLILTAER